MDKYTELYARIWYSFKQKVFSIDDFRVTFPSSQAAKVIYDLIEKGYLERINRGNYKAVKPKTLIKEIVRKDLKKENVLRQVHKKYAYCAGNAVSVWTDGYYWTGFTKGFNPKHIKVRKKDLAYWVKFFRRNDVNYTLAGKNKTLYGLMYVLHPEKDFKVVEKNGEKVITRKEVIKYCLEHEFIYSPALEYLDEKYNIGYRRRESIKT